jgi:hypothetical protein
MRDTGDVTEATSASARLPASMSLAAVAVKPGSAAGSSQAADRWTRRATVGTRPRKTSSRIAAPSVWERPVAECTESIDCAPESIE